MVEKTIIQNISSFRNYKNVLVLIGLNSFGSYKITLVWPYLDVNFK